MTARRVLVVDDDSHVLAVLEKAIGRLGHAVRTADSGERALEIYETDSCGIILTDIAMPGIDGVEQIRRLRLAGSRAYIVAISGGGRTGGSDHLDLALKAGADHAMRKPVSLAELQRTIEQATPE